MVDGEYDMNESLIVVGDGGPSGTYALGIKVAKPITIALGIQKKYSEIDLQGDVVYLGAARGEKGASSLNQRLHRHATRTEADTPHAIREKVRRTLFVDGGWRHLLANGKNFKWEIDWLLDHKQVVLKRITALQHPKDLDIEHSLAIRLDGDFQTHLIKRGLGAQDWKDGFDHLLRVTADDIWWRLLSVRMEALACEIPLGAQVTDLVESYLRGRYCLKQLGELGKDRFRPQDFRNHPIVEELVTVQQQIETEHPNKLEKMHKVQERKCASGEGSGVLRLYDFPQITEDRLLDDAKFAWAIERLRKAQGDGILDEVFSLQNLQTRDAIENLDPTPLLD